MCRGQSSDWKLIGELYIDSPSFVHLMQLTPSEPDDVQHLDLVISHFNEFEKNGVDSFENIGQYLSNLSVSQPPLTKLIDKTLTWPNIVYIAEKGVFDADLTLIIHDGFLTPFHGHGGVYALFLNEGEDPNLIRLNKEEGRETCYYHNSTMIDLDGDGLLDLLLAEVCESGFNQQTGSLVWLKQPASDPSDAESWIKTKLIEGPDFLTVVEKLNNDTLIVYSGQFWDAKVVWYYLNIGEAEGPYIDGNGTLIDDTIGAVEGIQIVDILKNGAKQLLVNDHLADGTKNGVYLYEFPEDFPYGTTNKFIKHQIAEGFNTTGKVGVGAPGLCAVYDLNPSQSTGKPHRIAVAGDGNFISWDLVMTDSESFTFSQSIIKSVGGTTGQIAIGDVNGDGYSELFMPFFENNLIYVFTANPDFQ